MTNQEKLVIPQENFILPMTHIRKIYQLMLIKSTFEAIESPLFEQRFDETQRAIQNLTNSKNDSTQKAETAPKSQSVESISPSEKIWSRFL